MQNPPLHLPRLCRALLARGTKSCLPSPWLTLAMPTELAFSSVMPWLVLSPRSHIPKSCREAAVRGVPQKPVNPTQCSQQAPAGFCSPPGHHPLPIQRPHGLPTAVL